MSIEVIFFTKFLITGVAAIADFAFFKRKIGIKPSLILSVFILWIGIFSYFLSQGFLPVDNEDLVLTALGECSEFSQGTEIRIKKIVVDGQIVEFKGAREGKWAWIEDGNESLYSWREWDKESTKEIKLSIPVGEVRTIDFQSNVWRGLVKIEYNGKSQLVDTFNPDSEQVTAAIDATDKNVAQKSVDYALIYFIGVFFFLYLTVNLLMLIIVKNSNHKLRKYHFLFTQLVKRDFTLKYKRTVLGMFWSILSPLLNLLIMWLVFNELLGNNVDHFIIYLFAGQLVYSYFSDATNQGMTSLLDNSGIFTKINVPKYMFLLSKNISSLMNFGLTLIIFFSFIVLEGLPFTWKFLMLIYPICCLVIFNIGMGLILSALFVFFRDMQYLWGIITQLIMWMSAIFYSIEGYPQVGQNLFLLNPIYLFIRYFRKIVIDDAVPTIWFHLMIAAYTLVVLLIGCRMYKKNNHEFLYYI